MCRIKNGNPAKSSRFICLCCSKQNYVGEGIQRRKQREFLHIKELTCINCGGKITKNVEVRYCDSYDEVFTYVPELSDKYYNNDGTLKDGQYYNNTNTLEEMMLTI